MFIGEWFAATKRHKEEIHCAIPIADLLLSLFADFVSNGED